MPVFSLASKFGIGCFSREAFDFIDFLERSGQGYWQVLPFGPTGYGNSPYQPFSAFAGNPYFISPEVLIEEGLLSWDDVNGVDFGNNQERVDYGKLYENREKVLRIAFENFKKKCEEEEASAKKGGAGKGADFADEATGKGAGSEDEDAAGKGGAESATGNAASGNGKGTAKGDTKIKTTTERYKEYCKKQKFWLEDYALYRAIKASQEGKSWLEWPDDLRKRNAKALTKAKSEFKDEIEFIYFEQFKFDEEWDKIRAYAKKKNVKIIGDLPFYVAMDSADSWSHPEVFQMDKDLVPKVVAGCPPDAFSATGQLWGNPIYDWDALKKNDYFWWVERIERNYEWYDVIRIDHFHGFAEYYAIPYGDETAKNCVQKKGPGMDLFNVLRKKLGDLNMIAEDLGITTEENMKLLEDSGFPGMKVLQFGFTSWDSMYVNHRHIANCVVYTGTHDNTPTYAWVQEINDGERDFTRRYINSMNTDYGALVWDIIREAYRSVANLCVIPLVDYLCKGREARLNTPGTAEGNWEWRLTPNFLSDDLARSIRLLAETYSRIPKAPVEED